LAGCSDDTAQPGPDTPLVDAVDVERLVANHTAYIGDNSAVLELMGAAQLQVIGNWSLELGTEAPPYSLALDFTELADDVTPAIAQDLMTDRATLLLATIDNADHITWTTPGGAGQLTRDEADAAAGQPVADLGATQEGLSDLVAQLDS
jgi:hypothetical protein